MIKSTAWIYICSALAFALARGNYLALTDTEIKYMKHKWDQCCETNKCIHSSCYIVEWAVSAWATVRQRCQSRYPDWPYNIDIFQIRNENDIKEFWNMLQDSVVPVKEITRKVWTSGARCSRTNSTKTELQTQWISTKEPFPAWLDERINETLPDDAKDANGCQFLVIFLAPNNSDVKYDFQDQNFHHSAICEFTLPEVKFTTKPVTEAEDQKPPTVSSTQTTKVKEVSATSTIQSTTETSLTPSFQTTIPEESKTETYSTEEPISSTDTSICPSTANSSKYCKGINQNGINWPYTLAGETARPECPEGMIGNAEWYCDEISLSFQPARPNIENCTHEWINRLKDSIRERHDAVEISRKLAEETKQNMSHGDIIALVDLTSNLLQLYTEQKGEEEFEVAQDEEVPVYYNFTKTMIASISNILRTEIKDAWAGLNDTRQTREATTILKLVTTIGSRLSCIKTSDEKLQFTVSEENIDLQTFILNNTDETYDEIIFPQENGKVESDSSIRLPANVKLNGRFSPCKSFNTGVGVIYKHVGDFLKAGQLNGTPQIATKVLSFSVSNRTESISLSGGKVNIILQHLSKQDVRIRYKINPRCVFWNFSKSNFGAWDDSGCRLISFNETHSECQCDHLTNFAVLMDVGDNIQDNSILTMMTYVCCGLSSLTLVLTLICFLAIRSLHGRRSIITGNLCFSLLITNMLILFGFDKTQDEIICAVVAGVLHYWILAAFCWMLVEGYHLYRMVILVFQRGSNLPVKFYYIFAYGVPLLVVGISAGIKKKGYGGKNFCWLSPDDGLVWSFVGPACAILLVNIVIFVLTLRSASSVKIKKEQTTIKRIKSWIRGSLSVMCLLGLTWSIGLLYMIPDFHFVSYIFTVLNGLQGVFIFLFHILLNDKVNSLCSCSSKVNKTFGRRKYLNHTSSNQTNSKTSTRTSLNSLGCTSSTKLPDSRKHSALSILRNCNASHEEIAEGNRNNSNKNWKVLYPTLGNESRLQASPL